MVTYFQKITVLVLQFEKTGNLLVLELMRSRKQKIILKRGRKVGIELIETLSCFPRKL